jgi:hypothetical protein
VSELEVWRGRNLGHLLAVCKAKPQPPTPCRSVRLGFVARAGEVYSGSRSQSIREVPPGELRLPPSRVSGSDPWKLHQQIRQFGSSRDGMPPILVYEVPNGVLEISDGVTHATRIAKLAPGQTVPIVVIGTYRRSRSGAVCARDRL